MDALLLPVFILFVILFPVIFLALLLYAIPVRAAATLVHTADRRAQVVLISWSAVALRISGHGTSQVTELLILDHRVLSHTGSLETHEEEEERDPAPEQLSGPGGTLQIGELIHIVQRITGPFGAFVSAFWQRSRFTDARGTVTLGLGNPALTGEVYGYYWASRFVLLATRIDIVMQPVFDRAVLEFDITIRGRIDRPLLVLVAGLDFLRHPAVKDAWKFGARVRTGVTGT